MNISNLNELLQTEISNEGSVSSVSGFSLSAAGVKNGFAFFLNDINELDLGLKNGAFAVIFENEIRIDDKDVYYLKTSNLKSAMTKLLRFLSEEKNLSFVLASEREIAFAKAFHQKILQNDIINDFKTLTKAKANEIFFSTSKAYLNELCANFTKLFDVEFKLKTNSSIFFTNIIYQQNCLKNLAFMSVYASDFMRVFAFLKQSLSFDVNKFDLYKVYFLNQNYEIASFGSSNRAVILVNNESEFEFLSQNLKQIKGFKTAFKNSLFCDFSYDKLSDLRSFFDFRYLLLCCEESEFIDEFKAKTSQELLLFNEI